MRGRRVSSGAGHAAVDFVVSTAGRERRHRRTGRRARRGADMGVGVEHARGTSVPLISGSPPAPPTATDAPSIVTVAGALTVTPRAAVEISLPEASFERDAGARHHAWSCRWRPRCGSRRPRRRASRLRRRSRSARSEPSGSISRTRLGGARQRDPLLAAPCPRSISTWPDSRSCSTLALGSSLAANSSGSSLGAAPEGAGPERRGDVALHELGDHLRADRRHRDEADILPRRHRRSRAAPSRSPSRRARSGTTSLQRPSFSGSALSATKRAILAIVAVLLLADGFLEGGEFVHRALLRTRRRWPRPRPTSGPSGAAVFAGRVADQLELLAVAVGR